MLTLEEINPYLNEGLKWLINYPRTIKHIDYAHTIGFIDNMVSFEKAGDYYFNDENDFIAKPLLFPLSCLDQEITVNGEVFIGRDEFSDYEYDLYSLEGFPLSKVLKHESFMELVKRKFDVFNLIPQSKAINVLEIDKNIYK